MAPLARRLTAGAATGPRGPGPARSAPAGGCGCSSAPPGAEAPPGPPPGRLHGRRRAILAAPAGLACGLAASGRAEAAPGEAAGGLQVVKSDEEWRQVLSKDAYRVLRDRKTERAGTSPLNLNKAAGTYRCAGCGKPLFPSATKFNSGTGWPSFYDPFPGAVDLTVQWLYLIGDLGCREVRCHDCGGHLGHVFTDGAVWGTPTGLRYCMNGVALAFEPAADSGAA